MKKTKIILCLLVVGLALVVAPLVLAQEPELFDTNNEIEEEIEVEVEAEDLDIEEPKLLPDSKFYFLKDWSRGIKSFFTFNKVKKAALKARYASERLLETRALVLKKKSAQTITKAARKYEEELENVKEAVGKIVESADTSERVSNFLDKFSQHQALHQNILKKLEGQVTATVALRIRQTREVHIERFGEVMLKLEDKTKIGARLEKNFNELGNKIKENRSLEILEELEGKIDEGARESIRNVRQRIKQRIEEREINNNKEEEAENENDENSTTTTRWIQIESIEVIGVSAN